MTKLNELVNAFIGKVEEGYSSFPSDQFYCDIEENAVAYGVKELEDEVYNGLFADFLEELGAGELARKFSTFTWAILHEVGHLETAYEVEEDYWLRELYFTEYGSKNPDADAQRTYMRLPSERAATEWAVFYAIENEELVERYDEMFRGEINI